MRIILFIFLFILLIFFIVAYLIFKGAASLISTMSFKLFGRDVFYNDDLPPPQDRGLTDEQKRSVIADSIKLAGNYTYNENALQTDLVYLKNELKKIADGLERQECYHFLENVCRINSFRDNTPDFFEHLAGKCNSLVGYLAESFRLKIINKDSFVTGLYYATEYTLQYILQLLPIASKTINLNIDVLTIATKEFIDLSEKMHWLMLQKPNIYSKYHKQLSLLISTLTDKYFIYSDIASAGVQNDAANNLLSLLVDTLNNANIALKSLIRDSFEGGMLHASAELEAISEDLKSRGF